MTKLDDLYEEFGQSPWIDNIRRDWLQDGTLQRLVESGVRGVTSNPAIFAKALTSTSAYDDAVASRTSDDPEAVFEVLAVADVTMACDILQQLHEESCEDFSAGDARYCDGFVSLEVSPRLAHDTGATVAEAKRLYAAVNRANVMIKVPATLEGLPAITELIGAGISVNVTLIFSLERYAQVLDAWRDGLQLARKNGVSLEGIASVASFFVSRVDAAVDGLLPSNSPLVGRTANAQVCAAYELYAGKINDPKVRELLNLGAQVQRPLWASTSTKNPDFDPLLYVDFIAGLETVNTMPDATLELAKNSGNFSRSFLRDSGTCHENALLLDALPESVNLAVVTDELERVGVAAFISSYADILATVSGKIAEFS
ncbi:MAG: transaldolase [Actinomycetota bacterium]